MGASLSADGWAWGASKHLPCGFWFQVEPVLVFTCFVLTDCVVGLVEIEFLLPPITSVASENSSGIAIEDGVDGNAVRKEVIGVQASESFVEPVPCIHLLCTRRLCLGLVEIEFLLLAMVSVA